MIRQRVRLRTPLAVQLVRLFTVALGVALAWYGLMVVLLAAKVSPRTVNDISAYRTIYDWAAGLRPADFTTAVSMIAGFGGLLVFLVFLALAAAHLPRPYLARGSVDLAPVERDSRGSTIVNPRALERVAELAACGNDNVASAAGRLGDRELSIDIGIKRARSAADTLRDVHSRVEADLRRHELPGFPVNVILTTLQRNHRRDLA
jgi:hypothetical protein